MFYSVQTYKLDSKLVTRHIVYSATNVRERENHIKHKKHNLTLKLPSSLTFIHEKVFGSVSEGSHLL